MARQIRRFVPRLEALCERALMSVSITEFPDGTLQIVGDDTANVISISDTGKSLPGSVTVEADGQIYFSQGPITRISVFGNGGNDSVEYTLSSDLTVNRTVSVDLGAGNDSFTATLDGQNLGSGTDYVIQALGGGGKDTMRLDATGVNIADHAHLLVDFEGGKGKDGVMFNYAPASVDPTASVLLTSDQKK